MPRSLLHLALAMAAVAAAAGGCASQPQSTDAGGTVANGRQTIFVEVAAEEKLPLFSSKTPGFGPLPGTECSLSNDRGTWTVVTPGDVSVELSDAPLRLQCRREGYPDVNRVMACVTPRTESMKAGALAAVQMLKLGPAAAPVAVGVGLGAVVLYLAGAVAMGAAAGGVVSGVEADADVCRYSLTGSIQVVMSGPPPERPAAARPAQAGPDPRETDAALSNPGSLADVVNGGRGTIVYTHTRPGGQVDWHRVAIRPTEGVLLALPQGYTLDESRRMATLAGVRFSPAIPIVSRNLSPGARWSHAGMLEEINGVARLETASSFEVVGRGPLATPAGTFTAVHVTELRWQAGTRYRIERWIDPVALVPLREEWTTDVERARIFHGIGSFSFFDPPFPEGTIEIRFVAGPG